MKTSALPSGHRDSKQSSVLRTQTQEAKQAAQQCLALPGAIPGCAGDQLWVLGPSPAPPAPSSVPAMPSSPWSSWKAFPSVLNTWAWRSRGEQEPKPLQWLWCSKSPRMGWEAPSEPLLPNTTPSKDTAFPHWDGSSKDTLREILTRVRAVLTRGRLF